MINFNKIQQGVCRTLNILVGKDACPERQIFTSPVIRSNQRGPLPDFPVVVVSKLTTGQYGISSVSDEYFDDLGNLTRETRYKASYGLTIHGDIDDDVLQIAQVIRDTLFTAYGIEELYNQTSAGLLAISSPSFAFNYLSTQYEEVARLTIDFSITDTVVEDDPNCPSTGVIESIVVDGELKDSEDDTDPLIVNSSAP